MLTNNKMENTLTLYQLDPLSYTVIYYVFRGTEKQKHAFEDNRGYIVPYFITCSILAM